MLRCFAGGFWRWPSSPPALSSASKPILPELHEQHFDTQMPGIARKNDAFWYKSFEDIGRLIKASYGIKMIRDFCLFRLLCFTGPGSAGSAGSAGPAGAPLPPFMKFIVLLSTQTPPGG